MWSQNFGRSPVGELDIHKGMGKHPQESVLPVNSIVGRAVNGIFALSMDAQHLQNCRHIAGALQFPKDQ